ncbi:tetratricopeptide repeat protein [Phytohabitans houttuyneae]|uniref:tetratricopeptide repeat protein n=1 Tax=Phytohabitans houttuyneae TaxID=1076126 RepID=UPI0031E8FF69
MAPPGCLVMVAAAGYGKTTALESACAVVPAFSEVSTLDIGVDDVCRLSAAEQVRLARWAAGLGDRVRVSLAARRPLAPEAVAALPGPVTERGPADLALSRDQVLRTLRDEHGVGDADLAYLAYELTAGWPALVHLAGTALDRAGAGRHDLLAALSEPGTAGASWVRDQVLAELPAPAGHFLDTVADLGPLSEPLCAALERSTEDGAGAMAAALRGLAAAGVVVPDRSPGALRVVPVIRAVVAHRAGTARRGRRAEAARWYRDNGHPLAAAQTFAADGDDERAAALVEARGDEMLAAGGGPEVARLVDALPPARRTPRLRLLRADALRMAGDVAGATRAFAPLVAEAERDGRWPAALAWRAAMLHYMRGDYRGALDILDRVAGGTCGDGVQVLAGRATVLVVLGETERAATVAAEALAAAELAGDDRAWAAAHLAAAHIAVGVRRDEHLARALAAAERAGDVVRQARLLANQADCLLRDARYPQALRVAARAVRAAEVGGPPGVLVTALHNAGEALTRLGRYDEATLHFERSIQVSHRAGLSRTAPGLYGLGEVNRLLGRRQQARIAFEEAAELARGHAELQILVPALVGLARVLVDCGEPDAAREAASSASAAADNRMATGPGFAAQAHLAHGWVALACGDAAEAGRCATRAVAAARECRQADVLAEALELAAAVGGEAGPARTALAEAEAIWCRAGAQPAADRVRVLLGRLPGADGPQRWAAREAAKRLVALGVPAVDGAPLLPVEAAPVRVCVLGRFDVVVGGQPVPLPAWRSRQARTLLKILIARRGRPVPRGELCELLWPDDDAARTAHRLSVLLSAVRNVLDPSRQRPADHYLRADPAGVCFDVGRVTLDVEDLLRDAAHGLRLAREGHAERAREILAEVDAAYRGDAFDDEPYETWADGLREEARAVWLRALRELAELCRRAGDLDQAATTLVRLLVADPYDEPAHRALVEVLRVAGRHGEAQRAFARWAGAMRSIDAPVPTATILRAGRASAATSSDGSRVGGPGSPGAGRLSPAARLSMDRSARS